MLYQYYRYLSNDISILFYKHILPKTNFRILPCMALFYLIKYSKNIQNRKLNKEKYIQVTQEG